MPGRMSFDIVLGAADIAARRVPGRSGTLRVLVLGDFSGRGGSSPGNVGARPVLPVDLDAFDATFRRLAPSLSLGAGERTGGGLAIGFDGLEDFHPDRLYATLDPFRALRESRARLLDPASFEREAASLMLSPAANPTDAPNSRAATREQEADLLQRLIGAPPEPARRHSGQVAIDALIRRLVQSHVKTVSARSPEPYLAALDASVSELMREILHNRKFQALESNWRGVRRFVEEVELGESVTVHVADVTKPEMLEDLVTSGGAPSASAANRLLTESSRGGVDDASWSLIVGLFDFGMTDDDVTLLAHLGVLASQQGAPLLAAARPDLLGCRDLGIDTEPRQWSVDDAVLERRWQALRRSPLARWLGLALPRVLLRQPYGARSEPTEAFAFEELAAGCGHEAFLWGNPALACAQALAAAHVDAGTDAEVVGPLEIADLPLYMRDENGERRLQPCAEFLISVSVGDEMLRRGTIPLLSYGNRNAVRIPAIRSMAEPPAALAGFD